MTVYVDELRKWDMGPSSLRFGSCHMLCDGDLDELHAMAQRIGLQRAWFQGGRWPHYDLAAKYRAKAVRAGAVEITAAEFMRRALEQP